MASTRAPAAASLRLRAGTHPSRAPLPYGKFRAGYPGSGWISWPWIGWTLIGGHCFSAIEMPGYPARVARITNTIYLDNQARGAWMTRSWCRDNQVMRKRSLCLQTTLHRFFTLVN